MSSILVKQAIKLIVLILPLLLSCDSSRPKSYITPIVNFNKSNAEMGTPVEVIYSFDTSKDFPGLKKDLTVFVHFLDPSNKIRFVDDHNPPVRTNQWGPATTYSYSRTYFIPENIPAGDYTVELGMYTPAGKGERFVLNAKQLSDRSYAVGKIRIQPPATLPTQFISGWYDLEREPNNDWYHWRWIGKTATFRVANPKSDSIVYLKAESERHRFQNPQSVSIFLEGRKLDSFQVESSETFIQKYRVDASALGTNPNVELKLEVDQTFKPSTDAAAGDSRELGLRVYCLYLGKEKD